MILKGIKINAFGKFNNKTIGFKPGINVIYGGNESGKSTLHKFIGAMFFGFFKPYSTTKEYTTDYDKFIPWDSTQYSGLAVYEKDNKKYRIQRVWDKQSETVHIYDELNGNELTDKLEFDNITNMPSTENIMGVTSLQYNKTISILQLQHKSDDEFSTEMANQIKNTTQTFSETFSAINSIKKLTEQKNAIGGAEQKNSDYDNLLRQQRELKEQLTSYYNDIRQRDHDIVRLDEVTKRISKINSQKDKIIKSTQTYEYANALKRFNRYNELRETIKSLTVSKSLDANVTDELFHLYTSAESKNELCIKNEKELREKLKNQENKIAEVNKKLSKFTSLSEEKLDEMCHDNKQLLSSIKKLSELRNSNKEVTINPGIYKKLVSLKSSEKIAKGIVATTLSLAIIFAIIGFVMQSILIYPALALGIVSFITILIWIWLSSRRAKVEYIHESGEATLNKTTNMSIMCELDISHLRKKYNCKDLKVLKSKLEQADLIRDKFEEYKVAIDSLEAVKIDISNELDEEIEKKNSYKSEMLDILTKAGVNNAAELKIEVGQIRQKEVIDAKIEAAIIQSNNLLEDSTLEELTQKATYAIEHNISPSTKSHFSDILEEKINMEFQSITNERTEISERLMRKLPSQSAINDLKNQISQIKVLIEQKKSDLDAIKLSINAITHLAGLIENNFSSEFHSKLDSTLAKMTENKYTKVVIKEDNSIEVYDNSLQKYLPISALSSSMKDQLHFAVRFTTIDLVLTDKTIPVFIDDYFIHYDDNKLKTILEYLNTEQKSRQIFIFTGRQSEKNVLDANGINYNYIKL